MTVVPFDPMEAQKHKIAFYSLPQDLDLSKIDELMRPIVAEINSSGWVWTAECCQGHPDATEAKGWDHNTSPYLRLVVADNDLALLLILLIKGCRGRIVEIHTVAKGPWVEVLLYVKAINVLQRNQGIEALTGFAKFCCGGHSLPVKSPDHNDWGVPGEASFDHKRFDKAVAAQATLVTVKPNLLASRLRALAEKIVIDPRFSVSIGSGVSKELQILFNAAADAVDENEELKCLVEGYKPLNAVKPIKKTK